MANIFNKLIPYKSPLELLLEHSKLCVEASQIMRQAFEKYFEGQNVEELSKQIDKLEDDADRIKIRVREIYAKLKWTYFSKTDFLDILHNMDSIIDLVDDVLKMLTMNNVNEVPTDVRNDILMLVKLVSESVEHMNETAQELRTIVESAFSPKEIRSEDERINLVEKEEHSSDILGLTIGKKLFAKKFELNPVDIVFLNSVVVLLMRIEDRAKNIVERIRMITHI
ncbi:MAG: DUF47 family protein [Fervidobacterium sp.]|nr:DUF47 family protein [Fervidobacterium sp.]